MNTLNKKYFISFADSRLKKSLKRIKVEAKKMACYDYIFTFTEKNLDKKFRKHFKKKLVLGSRGYGYWVWKPQIILQTLMKMQEGDIVHYCDAGCELNPKGRTRLLEYFDFANTQGMAVFQIKPLFNTPEELQFQLPDYKWTKGDVLDFFNVRTNSEIINSETIGAGILFIQKNDFNVNFVKNWLDVYYKNFLLVDDSPSKTPNPEGFVEHRHDQAILSILCKLNNVQTLSAFEYWYPSKNNIWQADWQMLDSYPIWVKRNKAVTHSVFRKNKNVILNVFKGIYQPIKKRLRKNSVIYAVYKAIKRKMPT